MVKIYVGNLPHTTTDLELRQAFESYGQVRSAKVIKDRASGQSRGFGFVEMPDPSEAQTAIKELHGQGFGGRTLTVNEARPREPREEPRPKLPEVVTPDIQDSSSSLDDDRRRRRDRRERNRRDRDRDRHDYDYEAERRDRRSRRQRPDDDEGWGSY